MKLRSQGILRRVGAGLAFFCLPAWTLAAPNTPVAGERALREECGAFSQAGMLDCLVQKHADSEKALRLAEKDAAKAFSRWDEDQKYLDQAKARLAASNRQFANYREAQCAFAAARGGGSTSSAQQKFRLACAAELNNQRAGQLRDAISDLPLK